MDSVSIDWWSKANGWNSLQTVCALIRLKSLSVWGLDVSRRGGSDTVLGSVREAIKLIHKTSNQLVHLGLHGNSNSGPSAYHYRCLLEKVLVELPCLETLDISQPGSLGVMNAFRTRRYVLPAEKIFVAAANYSGPRILEVLDRLPQSFRVLYAQGFDGIICLCDRDSTGNASGKYM